MSQTMVVGPIIGALVKAEDILGKERQWNAVNELQAHFLKEIFSKKEELSQFSEKELRNWISWQASELNRILEQEGFDIRLNEFARNEFGVVSILDVLVEWLAKGEKTQIRVGQKDYPAVKMELAAEVGGRIESLFQVCESSGHPNPIAVLLTKSGDRVYLTIANKPYHDFELISRIDEIRNSLKRTIRRYDYLEFPMVDLNHEVDISWLRGMKTVIESSGQEAVISQALQQTKFKMNEKGARVKSAVAIAIKCLSIPRPLLIDKPFFLWIERVGMSLPVMYAYINEEDWKDPGGLNM